MPAPNPDDLLVLQNELVDMLKTALASVRPAVHVLTPSDLFGETEQDGKGTTKVQPVPAVNVVYMGHKPGTDPGQQRSDGRGLVLQQLFAAEVVTRNVRTLKTGAAARNDAGPLAMRVMLALMGARLPSAASLVQLRPGPGPVFKGGTQYLPLMFQVSLAIVKP
ncbi:phage tail terminator protein [Hydrogenophaga sp. A37]|uniref:phage tail terminator protein n=1 Tax=Hydrogenophaga sp. A37 TaxID=1945864 RepID=UPI000985094C|nr:hypothetical protein [Hydrogenophaga sp. A37]OOG84254.1 hypothetical protein B0E41_10925 [Hydrogenophaga sp. A37]